jgi:hypothetical protein
MPLLSLLSRLVSAPSEKPQLAQNKAHPAPQQRYNFPIVSTWPLHTGNALALPQSTNQWGLSNQNAPPRSPLSPRERTTSEAAPGPKRNSHGPAAALHLPHRQYLAAAHRKPTCLTSKYQPVGALDSKCPSSVFSLAYSSERTTSEAAPGPRRSTHSPAAALRLLYRQYLAPAHRKCTCLTSKYQPVGALDSKCPSSVFSLA